MNEPIPGTEPVESGIKSDHDNPGTWDTAQVFTDPTETARLTRHAEQVQASQLADARASIDQLSTPDEPVSPESRRRPDFAAELAALPEQLEARTAAALEASDFEPTPEIVSAVETYYADHYKLALVVGRVVDNQVTADDLQALVDHPGTTPAMDHAMKSLTEIAADPTKRVEALNQAALITSRMLFKEISVGALTTGEAEADVFVDLAHRLTEAAVADGAAYVAQNGVTSWMNNEVSADPIGRLTGPNGTDDLLWRFDAVRQQTTQEERFAGQLLFHNSSRIGEIARGGYRLLSRTQQVKETGTYHAETKAATTYDGVNLHSNLTHWSGNYDAGSYKDITKFKDNEPGTLAVPIAEIITVAPYARNIEFGVAKVKSSRSAAETQVPITDQTRAIGAGGTDAKGTFDGDRSFLAANRFDDAANATAYALDIGAMTHGEVNTAYQIYTSAEARLNGTGYGRDEQGPTVLTLDYNLHATEESRANFSFTAENIAAKSAESDREEARLSEQIKQLQSESRTRPEYAGKLVVPLREGVMEFRDETTMSGFDAFGIQRRNANHSVVESSISAAVEDAAVRRANQFRPQIPETTTEIRNDDTFDFPDLPPG